MNERYTFEPVLEDICGLFDDANSFSRATVVAECAFAISSPFPPLWELEVSPTTSILGSGI